MTEEAPIIFAILTISDRSFQGLRPDLSGPALVQAVEERGWQVSSTKIVPDEIDLIRQVLQEWAVSEQMNIILTTGGTGFSRRDITPEATLAVIERSAPGLAEAMRQASLQVTPHAMLSRATAGIKGRVLIINLPGSPKAALENLAVIAPVLPHAVQLLTGDPGSEAGHNRLV
jgi:molybdopterin adenylyltransferase